ncbi:AI-2E family transporter [Microbacterium gorillae]|uniref:AI-2E family transporter n=1 Tax=Microbacterium gorillae TaxID=1231063 RepID=UPI003D977676
MTAPESTSPSPVPAAPVEAAEDAVETAEDQSRDAALVETADDQAALAAAEPRRRPRWTRIDRPFAFGFLVTLGALAAVLLGLALSNLSTILIYITFALFLALGLDPAVRALERRGLARAWAVVIVIAGLAVVLAVIVLAILPTVIDQISSFVASIPGTIQAFLASDFYATLEDQFGVGLSDVMTEVQKFLSDPSRIAQISGGALQIGGAALQVGAAIANGLSGALIVLVLTLYFLATMPSMKAGLITLAPARDRRRIDDISSQITDSVGGYVMGMVSLAFINALLVFVVYLVLKLPFPPLMATVAFLITLIPLVGSLLFWVIGTGIALFTSPVLALIFALVYFVYMQVEAYVITPRVMNRAIAIPGSLVVIGALVGGTLLGLLGALIAVPVTASILIIITQVWVPHQNRKV